MLLLDRPALTDRGFTLPKKGGLRPGGAASVKAVPNPHDSAVVGNINPKTIHFTPAGVHDIYCHLLGAQLVPSARRAVTGDGVSIGLTYKSSSFHTSENHTEP